MSSRSPSARRTTYLWSLTLRDLLLLVLVADLAMLAKAFLRTPIHVPGHSGLLWVSLFIVGRGLVDKPGAGLVLGGVAGVVATFLGMGKSGPFEWTKYAAAGALLELLVLFLPGPLTSVWKAAIVGAVAHLGKLAAMLIVALALQLPAGFIVLGLALSATTHVLFGALGGVVGALLLRELRRIPMYAAPAASEPRLAAGEAPPGGADKARLAREDAR
jgi:hypothetical protein